MTDLETLLADRQPGVVPPGTPPPDGIRRLRVLLIKPSKYDDDGYVIRFVKGVLPSNTLATLAGLTRQTAKQRALGDVRVDVTLLDEQVQKVDPATLVRRYRRRGTRVVVGLCGVQTAQFPRAADLALEFRQQGLSVMIGGFHVSGAVAMSRSGMPDECQSLLDSGVTLVKGEVEACWGDLLRDALHDRMRPFYEVTEPPDLCHADLPFIDRKLMRRFAFPRMGTIDASRGCPFSCSYCTIINVQGRTMRGRPASLIKEHVRRNHANRIDYYFFTDDNFSRNPEWEAIFDALIGLREEEGIPVEFMMQVDVPAWRNETFMTKASRAGCTQVFVGLETLNPDNLAASGKRQNRVSEYREMVRAWHDRGIACHVGYIIGFPFDSVTSVRREVQELRDRVGVDQASFFMLVPIPGSRDHADVARRGEWMESDYNRFDSFHPTVRHPRMTGEEWLSLYRWSWSEFYSPEGMKTILERATPQSYWSLLQNFVWYRYSVLVEGMHPMAGGFFRLKDRKQRRPGFAAESRWAHLRRRTREIRAWARGVVRIYFEMQDVWLATRGRAQIQNNLRRLRERYDHVSGQFGESVSRAGQALGDGVEGLLDGAGQRWETLGSASRRRASGLSSRLGRLRLRREPLVRRSSRILVRLDPIRLRTRTRQPLDAFWRQTFQKLRRGRVYRINPWLVGYNLARDVRLCVRFNLEILATLGT